MSSTQFEANAVAGTSARCAVCGENLTGIITGFSTLHRVTSDCKPYPPGGKLSQCAQCGTVQKPNDAGWRAGCHSIYSNYENYGHSAGVEQSVRGGDDGADFAPRSQLVLKAYRRQYSPPTAGRMLDYGCGMGPTTRAASEIFPDWTIDGFDLDRRAEATLNTIPGFGSLYSEDPSKIDQRYDLIVLMHALEHIPFAYKVLRDLTYLLNPGGHIVVQVPNRLANPFDLLVADHCIHFDPASLLGVAKQAGASAVQLSQSWVVKELSLVIGHGQPIEEQGSSSMSAEDQTGWLSQVAAICREAAGHSKLGVFGTSITATWLCSELGRAPDFYVDEDPAKSGRSIDGVPILRPDEVDKDSHVLLAMAPEIAGSVARRLAHLNLNLIALPNYSG